MRLKLGVPKWIEILADYEPIPSFFWNRPPPHFWQSTTPAQKETGPNLPKAKISEANAQAPESIQPQLA